MEDIFRLNHPRPEGVVRNGKVNVSDHRLHLGLVAANNYNYLIHMEEETEPDGTGSDMSDRLIKNQIATHPLYPNLVSAYIDCQKVGAPTELASLLEEIGGRESQPTDPLLEIGDDPELDEFMESYCEVLHRYKQELSKPFNEATLFLCHIESQLSDLCKGTTTVSSDNNINNRSDEAGGTSEDELSCGKVDAVEGGHDQPSSAGTCNPGDQELKEMLLRKYGGYLSSLRKEFLKKRKKGKLPKDARKTMMDWWNAHYRWPYPTIPVCFCVHYKITTMVRPLWIYLCCIYKKVCMDGFNGSVAESVDEIKRLMEMEACAEEEKLQLSEMTGLDIKQINNWFINQRKRHWKPSEDMRFSLMEGVSGGAIGGGPM